jgi:SAM-dependent methyltransferase
VRRHFEESAREYFRIHSGEEGPSQDLRETYWEALRGRLRGSTILDAACGPANLAHRVREMRGGTVIGVDFSLPMLRLARERYPDVPVVAGDLRRLPFRSGSFDLAYCFRSLQHVPALAAALSELGRVTAGGGDVVFDYVNRWNPLGYLREKASGQRGNIYLKAQSRRRLTSLCRRVGIEPVERLPLQLFPDRANIEKRLGATRLGWLGRLAARLDRAARRWPVLRGLALRALIVARKPASPRPLEPRAEGEAR